MIARLLREKEAAQQQLQSQQHLLLQLQRSVVAEAGAAEGEVGETVFFSSASLEMSGFKRLGCLVHAFGCMLVD